MKLDITLERLYEIVTCVADCGLDADEACEYAKSVVVEDMQSTPKQARVVDSLDRFEKCMDDNISLI